MSFQGLYALKCPMICVLQYYLSFFGYSAMHVGSKCKNTNTDIKPLTLYSVVVQKSNTVSNLEVEGIIKWGPNKGRIIESL